MSGDAVTSKTIFNGSRKLIMHFTNNSDGTGESSVVKVDKSTFTGPNGLEPSQIMIEKIEGQVNGGILTIQANHTSTLVLAQLDPGSRINLDFRSSGGLPTSGSGGTGDIEFVLPASLTAGGYDLILHMKKKD
jgi:hypothetical protein